MEETSEAIVEKTNETVAATDGAQDASAQAPAVSSPDDSGLLGQDAETSDAGSGAEEPAEKPANEATDDGVLGAPENGYVFSEFPEGSDTTVVAPLVDAARELNLSQDATQKLLSAGLKGLQAKSQAERDQLRNEALKDKNLGFVNNVSPDIGKAFAAYFADKPRVAEKLRAANLDVDREFLGALAQIGRDISDGRTVAAGAKTPTSEADDFRSLFPNTKMNR